MEGSSSPSSVTVPTVTPSIRALSIRKCSADFLQYDKSSSTPPCQALLPSHLALLIKNVLDIKTCAEWSKAVLDYKTEWIDHFDGALYTLGRSWYTDLEEDKEAFYFADAPRSDALVEKCAPSLQKLVLKLFTQLLGDERVKQRAGWCGPGQKKRGERLMREKEETRRAKKSAEGEEREKIQQIAKQQRQEKKRAKMEKERGEREKKSEENLSFEERRRESEAENRLTLHSLSGIHAIPPEGCVAENGGEAHFDTEGLERSYLEKRPPCLTIVLMLQPPEYGGGGLRVWDLMWDKVRAHGISLEDLAKANIPSDDAIYETGDLLVLDAYRLHQILPFSGKRIRISATAHAVWDEQEQYWLVWF